MDINVQQLSNISSGSTEQANNAYNTSRAESNIQNVPNSSAGNVNNNANAASILKNLMPGDVLSGIINQIKESQVLIGFNDGSLLSAHLTGMPMLQRVTISHFLLKIYQTARYL